MLLAFLIVVGGLSWLYVREESLVRMSIAVNATLMAGMFLITAIYTKETTRIANGTQVLAEEAAMQRQRDFLPIVDIAEDVHGTELISLGLKKDQGMFPDSITCRLTNVDRSPTFDCRYSVVLDGESTAIVTPTFLVGQTVDGLSGPTDWPAASSRLKLQVESDGAGSHFLRVTYQDTFGNKFLSRKDVLLDHPDGILGPLRFDSTS
jgi:hypothetical protein